MKTASNLHVWFKPKFMNYECCKLCGVVRRKDNKNKPCRGPVKMRPPEVLR